MHRGHDHVHAGGAIASSDEAMCPVMEMVVSKKEAVAKGLVRKRKGKQYYLCCSTCAAQFDADSERYALEEDDA